MLTESHYAALRLVRCSDKPAYRKHMCGVCHALGDDYGLPYRVLTNHETILLNMLTGAQCEHESETVMRRCPLAPVRFVRTNRDGGSTFAAAVTVALAAVKADDDITDDASIIARLTRGLLNRPEQTAFSRLAALGFDFSTVQKLSTAQANAEQNNTDPAAPSEAVAAALFEMTAKLSGSPENVPALATAGAHYGRYIYLADAHRDLAADMKSGAFNPLRPFAEMVNGAAKLSDEGEAWLITQMTAIVDGIREAMRGVTLHRDRATLSYLLTAPAKKLLGTLTGEPDAMVCRTCNTTASTTVHPFDDLAERRKKRKRRRRKDDDDDEYCCCCDTSWIYCDDCCSCNCCDCDCCSCKSCDCCSCKSCGCKRCDCDCDCD